MVHFIFAGGVAVAVETQHHLVAHIRTHTGETPFQCPYCYQQFRDKSNMQRHVQRHGSERLFMENVRAERRLRSFTEPDRASPAQSWLPLSRPEFEAGGHFALPFSKPELDADGHDPAVKVKVKVFDEGAASLQPELTTAFTQPSTSSAFPPESSHLKLPALPSLPDLLSPLEDHPSLAALSRCSLFAAIDPVKMEAAAAADFAESGESPFDV